MRYLPTRGYLEPLLPGRAATAANSVLQKVQTGDHSVSSVGNNVNASA